MILCTTLVKIEKKAHFFGNKTVDQRSGANLKKSVFCKNLLQIFCFFLAFCRKNAENDYFDQRLECAAPKRWSKYTTPGVDGKICRITNILSRGC